MDDCSSQRTDLSVVCDARSWISMAKLCVFLERRTFTVDEITGLPNVIFYLKKKMDSIRWSTSMKKRKGRMELKNLTSVSNGEYFSSILRVGYDCPRFVHVCAHSSNEDFRLSTLQEKKRKLMFIFKKFSSPLDSFRLIRKWNMIVHVERVDCSFGKKINFHWTYIPFAIFFRKRRN